MRQQSRLTGSRENLPSNVLRYLNCWISSNIFFEFSLLGFSCWLFLLSPAFLCYCCCFPYHQQLLMAVEAFPTTICFKVLHTTQLLLCPRYSTLLNHTAQSNTIRVVLPFRNLPPSLCVPSLNLPSVFCSTSLCEHFVYVIIFLLIVCESTVWKTLISAI